MTGIGFGTWAWGNQLLWGYSSGEDDPDLKATFAAAVAAGLCLVDTADSYGTGRLNGRWRCTATSRLLLLLVLLLLRIFVLAPAFASRVALRHG